MTIPLALSERSQSLARTLKKRLSVNKASEAAQLQPVALAGASNKFQGESQVYRAFATNWTPPIAPDDEPGERDGQYVLPTGEPAAPRHDERATSDGGERACQTCGQAFLESQPSTHRHPDFCSLDCKSAFLLSETEGNGEVERSPGSDSGTDSTARRPRCQWV